MKMATQLMMQGEAERERGVKPQAGDFRKESGADTLEVQRLEHKKGKGGGGVGWEGEQLSKTPSK